MAAAPSSVQSCAGEKQDGRGAEWPWGTPEEPRRLLCPPDHGGNLPSSGDDQSTVFPRNGADIFQFLCKFFSFFFFSFLNQ